MTSPKTINRRRKVELCKQSLNNIVDILLADYVTRDAVNMAQFKEMSRKVSDIADTIKRLEKNYT